MKIKAVLLIIILSLIRVQYAYTQTVPLSGLYFSSHEVIKDKRTTLELTPEEPFALQDGFQLEFDARFRPGDGYYGYVFRIIGNENVNIDLVSNLGPTSDNFSLILKDNILASYSWDDIPNGEFEAWMNIKLELDIKNSEISISLNGNKKAIKADGISDLTAFDFVFGAFRNSAFLTTDVAPMTLKDIEIYVDNRNLFRNWKLANHSNNKVYDEIVQAKAIVYNPIWEINKHLEWRKDKSLQIENLIGVAKDEAKGRVFLVDNKAVYIYDIASSVIDTLYFSSGQPFHCAGNQLIYNKFTDELWSYDFNKSDFSIFDFEALSWSLSEPVCEEPDLWHHNKFISPVDTNLVAFGGYGHYNYKNSLRQFDRDSGEWEKFDFKNQIEPRYMSALGLAKNQNILIFGGYGSKTGRQELSPEFYYDLYYMDGRDFSLKKLWTLDTVMSPFVPCESLLVDAQTKSFYTLIYNTSNFETSLRLVNFKIDEPEIMFFADSIPYKFLDTKSWSTLFLNEGTSELIALTVYDSEVNLYSLAYPALLPEHVYQQHLLGKSQFALSNLWTILTLSILILALASLYFFKKSKKSHLSHKLTNQISSPGILPVSKIQREIPSSIYFLGGLQVYNKKGYDITSNFTPTLKQLFLLIYLSSLKNGKGISSVKLKDTLWFDKTDSSARNNQNVNISKLRNLLEKVGDIKLDNNTTYWKITLDKGVYCDYTEALELIEKSKASQFLEQEDIFRFIQIISSGELCPNAQSDWMDEFKADFANKVIDTLTLLSKNLPDNIQNKYNLLCDISECILKYDNLNEEAIATKCSILYQSGKKGVAKHSYDLFCREYKNLLGVEYPLTFNEVLKT